MKRQGDNVVFEKCRDTGNRFFWERSCETSLSYTQCVSYASVKVHLLHVLPFIGSNISDI